MFKRRPLGTNKTDQPQAPTSGASAPPVEQPQQAVRPPQGAQAPQGSQPPRPQANNVGANPRRNRNRNRSRNNQNQATPGQPQSQAVGAAIGAPANKQNPQQRSGNRQRPQQNAQQNSGRKNQNRRPQNRRPTKPQFPAYIQRDLLLVAVPNESTKGIEEVRLKFDPLAKKIPAHVTLLFPEHEEVIKREFLKSVSEVNDLPTLATLTFSSVQVRDDMYLWLMPDSESSERVKSWHQTLVQKLEKHTQEETFEPHITLGYVPRSLTSEQAVDFAKKLVKLPLTLNFENILLEEFSENQNSLAVDSIKLNEISQPL